MSDYDYEWMSKLHAGLKRVADESNIPLAFFVNPFDCSINILRLSIRRTDTDPGSSAKFVKVEKLRERMFALFIDEILIENGSLKYFDNLNDMIVSIVLAMRSLKNRD